jgi:hypothetical protein
MWPERENPPRPDAVSTASWRFDATAFALIKRVLPSSPYARKAG